MSRILTLQLSEETYAGLEARACDMAQSPSELAIASLDRQFGSTAAPANGAHRSDVDREAARGRVRRHFGAVSLPEPIADDNEALDAALAREYESTHEEG